jgi:hypothetical protein
VNATSGCHISCGHVTGNAPKRHCNHLELQLRSGEHDQIQAHLLLQPFIGIVPIAL